MGKLVNMGEKHKCRVCGDDLGPENCYMAGLERRIYICRPCDCAQRKIRYKESPQQHLGYRKSYKERNKEKIAASDARYRDENREEISNRKKTESQRSHNREYMLKRKTAVFKHYSHGSFCCAQCGFSDIRALSVDHIEGGGRQHRREINQPIYHWLFKNGFPEGYQILCMNCQFIKRTENNECSNKAPRPTA